MEKTRLLTLLTLSLFSLFLIGFIGAVTTSPSTNTLVTTSGTQNFSVTFTNNPVSCTYAIGVGGTSGSGATTGSITPSGAVCSFTKTYSTSADNGNWYWYINSVNETVTNQTNAYLNSTGYQLTPSGSTYSGYTLTAIWGVQGGLYNVSIPLANATVSSTGLVTNATTVTNSNVSYSYVYNDAPGTYILQAQLPAANGGLPQGYQAVNTPSGSLSVVQTPSGFLSSISLMGWLFIVLGVIAVGSFITFLVKRRK